ncbi:30S ribosomal protein S15, partial [Myxococcota bacterium]|nr:30S ribosomal protein S15 [Myxococcota bacterium]
LMMVSQRKRHLKYLKKVSVDRYRTLITELGLRK